MVYTQLIGGLGNQLFQYAAAKSLARRNDTEVVLDIGCFETYKLHKFSLQHFNVRKTFASSRVQKLVRKDHEPYTFSERLFNRLLPLKIDLYEEPYFQYNPDFLKLKRKEICLVGYFQSEKYFKDIESEIRKDFKVITPLSPKTAAMKKLMDTCDAVSLHVRRADYVTNDHTNSVHGTCDGNYYNKAVDYIKSKETTPVFFVFSDDIAWAKENIVTGAKTHFVDFNDADTNYQDLYLMSNCKHNIIANSSFSWWGAWLNGNKNKIVIAPSRWFNNSPYDESDVVPENWIRI
jgi:hypothetical protein